MHCGGEIRRRTCDKSGPGQCNKTLPQEGPTMRLTRRKLLKTIPALALCPPYRSQAASAHPKSTYLSYYPIDLSKGGVQSDISDLAPYTGMKIGAVAVTVDSLPKGLRYASDVGVVVPEWVEVRVVQRFPQPDLSPESETLRRFLWRSIRIRRLPPTGDHAEGRLSANRHFR